MKRLLFLICLSLGFIFVAQAQDIEFEAFSNELYGVQGQVPVGWESRGFGSYARAESATDITAIFIQAAPLPVDSLLNTLKVQLGLETMPEASGTIDGVLQWESRRVDTTVQGMNVSASLATAEVDNMTYLVLLQSLTEEHDALVESVFVPVVQSVAPLTAEAEETEVPYNVEEVSFTSGEFTLAGTLTIPDGEGPFPVVVLITGSGPQDRDESLAPIAAIKPFRDIADYLTRNGIAVLRYDERGVGASEGDYNTATLEDFAADASAAVEFLLARDEFSAIGLMGHSEGGIVAPYVANENENVDFVIALAGPAVSMYDLLLQQNRRIYATTGMAAETIEAIVSEVAVAFDALIAGDDEALRASIERLIELQGAEVTEATVEAAMNQLASFQRLGYFDWDVTAIWGAVEQPILGIYGDLDVQVDSAQNAPALEAATTGNEDVTVLVYPTMNHILQEAETGGVEEYGTLEQSVRTDVLEAISEWILERF